MSTSASTIAPTSYWNLLHDVRELPPHLQAHLSHALAEGLAATTHHHAVITRDPQSIGDHKAMQVEVYSSSRAEPDPCLVSTSTHQLSRKLPEEVCLVGAQEPPSAPQPTPEALFLALNAITAAKAAFPARLARTATPSTRAHLALQLLLEADNETRAEAVEMLTRSITQD